MSTTYGVLGGLSPLNRDSESQLPRFSTSHTETAEPREDPALPQPRLPALVRTLRLEGEDKIKVAVYTQMQTRRWTHSGVAASKGFLLKSVDMGLPFLPEMAIFLRENELACLLASLVPDRPTDFWTD